MPSRIGLSALAVLAFLLAGAVRAEDGGIPDPGRETVRPPGGGAVPDPDAEREARMAARIADRQRIIDERTRRQADREQALKDLREGGSSKGVFVPRIRLLAGLSLAFPGGDLKKGPASDPGNTLGFRGDLDVRGPVPGFECAAQADLSPKTGVSLGISYFGGAGSETPGSPLRYHGTVFAAGDRIETRIGNLLGGGEVYYRGLSGSEASLWVRAGVRYWRQDAVLRAAAAGRVRETLDAFFPVLGASLEAPLGPGVWATAEAFLGYLRFGEGDASQENAFLSASFGVSWEVFRGGRVRCGLSVARLESSRESDGAVEASRLTAVAPWAAFEVRIG